MREIEGANCYVTIDKNNLYGIADQNGKVTVENTYLYIDHAFSRYFIAYKDREGHGIIDKDGNVLIDFEYDVLSKIEDKKILKGVNMEKNGDTVTIFSPKMEKISSLSGGNIKINSNYIELFNDSKSIFIDNEGNVKTAKELFENNKLFGIEKNGKWGFEDKTGNITVECKYDTVTEFNEAGVAGVRKDGKWGVIDENGNLISECIFEFGSSTKPEFLGKYYKTYKENNEIYYANEVTDEIYENGL